MLAIMSILVAHEVIIARFGTILPTQSILYASSSYSRYSRNSRTLTVL